MTAGAGRRRHGPRASGETVPERPGVRAGRVRALAGAAADRIVAGAPRIPVRDLATLRRQFPGLGPEELADKLVAGAVHGTATVGAGVGAAAMLPVPPAMPAELATEIAGVASIEIKLIAELHEVYGLRPPGTVRQRAMAYVGAWTDQRGVDAAKVAGVGLNGILGAQMRRELRRRVGRRTLRYLPTLTPFLVGAAAGALLNRRDTRRLAERVRADLRGRQVPWVELERVAAVPHQRAPHRALPEGKD